MQALGPPDKSPLQGLVASRIETYGGRYRASVASPPVNVNPRGGLFLVSPGHAPEVTWAGQAGGHPGFKSLSPCQALGGTLPRPHLCLLSWVVRERTIVWAQGPRTPHPPQTDGADEAESQEGPGPWSCWRHGAGGGRSPNPGFGASQTPTPTREELVSGSLRPAFL